MGTVSLEINLTAGAVAVGDSIPAAKWSSGFDHAALVTASRSRADGFDLRIDGVTSRCPLVSISGANTSSCKIVFNAPLAITAPSIQGYTLTFGNLGRSTTPYTAAAGPATSATMTVAPDTASTLALPSPGFPVTRTDVHDVEELAFPEWRTSHRSAMNENPRKRYGLVWRNISPEDYYEIRAFVRSLRGVGSFTTYPAVLASAYGYRIVPGSLRCEQTSKLGFGAELELEEVYAS